MSEKQPPDQPPFDPVAASKVLLKFGHSGWLGLRYSDHGENWIELELPWREDLLGEPDRHVLASGPVVSLMDMASGMSFWLANKVFQPIATLDLRVDYQRASRERSAVWGRVECYRTTRSAVFVRGIAHDGDADDPVATMAGVFMKIRSNPSNTMLARMEGGKDGGSGDA